MDAVTECITGVYDSKIAEAEILFDHEDSSIQLTVRNKVLNPFGESRPERTAVFESEINLEDTP